MCCLLWGLASPLQAQISPGTSGEGTFSIPDSLKNDSIVPQKEVDILTEWFDLETFARNQYSRKEIKPELSQTMYFDALHRLDGFVMGLGQIGKPYRRYRYGIDASILNTGIYENPYTRQEDIYMMDPARDVRYYDTRTPYIDIYYGQGNSNLSALRVELAQNVTPWWNISALFRREIAQGSYDNFTTDHYNIYLATNFRTKNDRYHLFVNGTFQQLNDLINGGVNPTGTEITPNSFFGKGAQPVILTDAALAKVNRAAYLQQFYRLIQDTVETPHRLLIYNSVQRDFFENQFTDAGITSDINLSGLFPVYPTITDSTTLFYERYRHSRWIYKEGISYRYVTPTMETGHEIAVANHIINFDKNLTDFRLDKLTRSYEGDFTYRPLPFEVGVNWKLHRTTTNFFAPERRLEADAHFDFPKEKVDFTYYKEINNLKEEKSRDSVLVRRQRRPFSVFAGAFLHDRNPSLQQSFGNGFFGTNSFTANRDLNNMRTELYRAGIELRAKDQKTNYGYLEGHRLKVTAFQTRQRDVIFFGPGMELLQAGADTAGVDFTGLEAEARLRWKHWVASGRVNYQIPNVFGDTTLENYYLDNQPHFYANAALYWEKHDIKIARAIRVGVEYHFQPIYFQQLFDPVSQQFYPQNSLPNSTFLFPSYNNRIDLFFSAQIKRAQIFIRYYNVAEGLFDPGYFTVFGYPMWDRDLQVGIVWSFFD